MINNEILDQLQNIFRDIFDDDSIVIKNETCADDIDEWDSLAQINLIVAIEKELRVKFSLEELTSLENVGDMIALIAVKVE